MEIITATALSSQQKELVQELFRACREFEGMTLTFPAEDGDFFVLCMENGTLATALALYYLEPHLYECTAATRPDMRKRGYFSKALAQAELHFPNSDFSFVTDGRCPASAFVLKKLNARFWYNEHMMTLELSQWQPPVCALPPLLFHDRGRKRQIHRLRSGPGDRRLFRHPLRRRRIFLRHGDQGPLPGQGLREGLFPPGTQIPPGKHLHRHPPGLRKQYRGLKSLQENRVPDYGNPVLLSLLNN